LDSTVSLYALIDVAGATLLAGMVVYTVACIRRVRPALASQDLIWSAVALTVAATVFVVSTLAHA
jgi:hypothetical protein